MDNLEFMSKFKPTSRCMKEFKHWIICIRAKHNTLGSAVILLKRQILSLGDMTKEEGAEFPEVINWYEKTCMQKFKAVKFNYIIAMMKDSYVHYHAFPRYDKKVTILGRDWCDEDWPKAIDFSTGIIEEEAELEKIKDYMIDESK